MYGSAAPDKDFLHGSHGTHGIDMGYRLNAGAKDATAARILPGQQPGGEAGGRGRAYGGNLCPLDQPTKRGR